jgi:DNA-binding MarR family transcriptional regulator
MTSVAPHPRSGAREQAFDDLAASFKGALTAVRRLRGRDTQRPGELSFAQYHLLFGLREHASLSTGDLAATAELTPATVTQMLDALVAMGLVERTRSTSDRRIVMCSLTDRGRELITERRASFERRWRSKLSDFTADELATAAAVVERLRTFYEELLDDGPGTPAGRARRRSTT